MMDYHKAAKQLLRNHDYRVYGKITKSGCSFFYPERRVEPHSTGFRRDYQLNSNSLAIQSWNGEELRDSFDVSCPPYARKSCIICDTIFCCGYLQYSPTLITYFVGDVEIEEVTFLKTIDGGDEETSEMLEKELALKMLIGQAHSTGFSTINLATADQYGILEGYDVACKFLQGDIT